MTDFLATLVVWLNTVANALGAWLLAPLGVLPGYVSATLVAVVTGVLLLVVFKYTSHQRAIKRVRDGINADLLTLKLFKDSARVAVQSQGRLLVGAAKLLVFALVPMVVMFLPVTLILGQLSLWYQQRPLRVGEEVVVTLQLNGDADSPLPDVTLRPSDAVETTDGPVRIQSKREVCWNVRARENGVHRLMFDVNGQTIDKELAVGDGFMRVSARRPERVVSEVLMHPAEAPFGPDSPVRSIDVDYPPRSWWTVGPDWLMDYWWMAYLQPYWWMAYWFGVSMVAGFCFRRVLNVNV
jgi:hypothetical protein